MQGARRGKTKGQPLGLRGQLVWGEGALPFSWQEPRAPLCGTSSWSFAPLGRSERTLRVREPRRASKTKRHPQGMPFCFGAPPGTRSRGGVRKAEWISAFFRPLVGRGSDSPPDCHSLPRLFESLSSHVKKQRRTTTRVILLCLVHLQGLEPWTH